MTQMSPEMEQERRLGKVFLPDESAPPDQRQLAALEQIAYSLSRIRRDVKRLAASK